MSTIVIEYKNKNIDIYNYYDIPDSYYGGLSQLSQAGFYKKHIKLPQLELFSFEKISTIWSTIKGITFNFVALKEIPIIDFTNEQITTIDYIKLDTVNQCRFLGTFLNINYNQPINKKIADRIIIGDQIPYDTEIFYYFLFFNKIQLPNLTYENLIILKNLLEIIDLKLLSGLTINYGKHNIPLKINTDNLYFDKITELEKQIKELKVELNNLKNN